MVNKRYNLIPYTNTHILRYANAQLCTGSADVSSKLHSEKFDTDLQSMESYLNKHLNNQLPTSKT